jgi:type IV pilus assembly protein PilN
MIRINLLPRKVTKKKKAAIRHVVVGALVLVLVFAVMGYLWYVQKGKITTLRRQLDVATSEKEKLKNVNQEKAQYEKTIADLKHRIDVISTIEKGRAVPVHIMDDLTMVLNESMPIWLTRLSFTPKGVQLEGYSFTNEDLSRFLKKVEESGYLANVNLIVSQKQQLTGKDVYLFSITAEIEEPKPAPPAAGGKG